MQYILAVLIAGIYIIFRDVYSQLNNIKMNNEEVAKELADFKAQVDKSNAEIAAKIIALEGAITNAGEVTPEVVAAMEALKASIQKTDDIVPDAPIVPEG